jgi:hypothetical protein
MKIRTLAAAALALGLSACSAEFSPVGIYAICSAPAPDTTNGSCLYPATCDTVFAGTPVLDATVAEVDFRLPVQINNLLTDNSSTADGRINTNDAYIQYFDMTYAGAPLDPWTIAASITVPTNGSSGAVLRLIPVEYFPKVVPPGASTLSILVNVRARGVLASQSSFTTAWFQVPVSVCAGCLASSFTCATGAVLASCPSAKRFGAPPGQTANLACVTLQ